MSPHLLILDDEAPLMTVLAIAIRDLGWQVSTTSEPQNALDLLRNADVDVFLTDYRMPQCDGLEVVKTLRQTRSTLPVLLMSGSPGEIDSHEIKRLGILAILEKPVDVDSLTQALNQVVPRMPADLLSTVGPTPKRTKILLVDDHREVLAAVKELLKKSHDLVVVGTAPNGRLAVQRAGEWQPQIIVMDISMPVMGGIEATRAILAEHPEMHVLICSSYAEESFVTESFRAGTSGYVIKEDIPEELIAAIRTVLDGRVFISKAILKPLGLQKNAFQSHLQKMHERRRSQRNKKQTQIPHQPGANRVFSTIGDPGA